MPGSGNGSKLVTNTIFNPVYTFFGASEYQLKVSNDIKNTIKDLESKEGQIVVLKYLPRLGKTYTLLDYLNNSENTFSLYVSDVHEQMGQMAQNFEKMWVIKGAAKICPLLNDLDTPKKRKNELEYLFSGHLKKNLACRFCKFISSCEYTKQFDFPENDVIVTIAKESLVNTRIYNKFDYIIFDESMVKASLIEPTIPEIDIDAFGNIKHGYNLLEAYEELKKSVDSTTVIDDRDLLRTFKEDADYVGSDKVLKDTLNEYWRMDAREREKAKGVIPFMTNLYQTVEWAQRCCDVGEYRPTHYKPYIHNAFDLLRKYDSNLILANATFDKQIYDYLKSQYLYELPELRVVCDLPIENKNSFLLHYVTPRGRSCSREGLKNYRREIFPMVEAIPRFCQKRGLKSGLITFQEYEDSFPDFDVVDHFVAHRGKDDFDDVDVLTILGTFNISRYDYLLYNYCITGEYLPLNALKEWFTEIIGISKVSVPVHDMFRVTRMYHLYEEHMQALLRSGAHIKDGRVVISFGYVPQDVKNMFKYEKFMKTKQLINGYLMNFYDEKRRKKKK